MPIRLVWGFSRRCPLCPPSDAKSGEHTGNGRPSQLSIAISALPPLSHHMLPPPLLQWERAQVCGLSGSPCAILKTQTSVKLVFVLTLEGRVPWGKFVPQYGQGTHSQGFQKPLLAEESKASYTSGMSLTFHLQNGHLAIPAWFSYHKTPEVTWDSLNCLLHWSPLATGHHFPFPSLKITFECFPSTPPATHTQQ